MDPKIELAHTMRKTSIKNLGEKKSKTKLIKALTANKKDKINHRLLHWWKSLDIYNYYII